MKYFDNKSYRHLRNLSDMVGFSTVWLFSDLSPMGIQSLGISRISTFKIPAHIATSDTRSTCPSIWDLKARICHQMCFGGKRHCWRGRDLGFKHTVQTQNNLPQRCSDNKSSNLNVCNLFQDSSRSLFDNWHFWVSFPPLPGEFVDWAVLDLSPVDLWGL